MHMGDQTMMHNRRVLGVAAAAVTVTGLLLPTQSAVAALPLCSEPGVITDSPTTRSLGQDCTADATINVPNGWTFDGNAHTITADPGLTGAVIESAHGTAGNPPMSMTVGHVTIAGVPSGVTGILFFGAEGRVGHVAIQGGENGVEANNLVGANFAATTDLVKVGRTTISGY